MKERKKGRDLLCSLIPLPNPLPKGEGDKNCLRFADMRRFLFRFALALLVPLTLIAFVDSNRPLTQTVRGQSEQDARALIDQPLDLLFLRGKLVDGTGKNPRTADIGIRGDRIVFVGHAGKANLTATRIIDAKGFVIAPGFIDPHTHTLADLSDTNRKSNEAFLMQGVTTVITGNDGGSALNIGATLRRWDAQGIGTNAILLAGHGTVRGRVMGQTDAQPTPAQLEEMRQLVARAMDEGAFGLSTGLYYAPGSYAKTEEVIELAKAAAARGGIYDTHMRSESAGLLDSVAETLRIGREARIPVHISHIKALGPEAWQRTNQVIKLIKQARAEGIDASACQYPYTASGTSLQAALVPRWAEVGGRAELLKRIDDPQIRLRLLSEMEDNLKLRGGPDKMQIADATNRDLVGKRLDAIAKELNKTPAEAALDLIKLGSTSVISFNMNEKDVQRFMKERFVTTCSDGSAGHPRKYGTFPRKLREYVYNHRLINLPFAVRNGSALTAEIFRIPDRGLIREGYFADVIVFDEKTIADRATYEQPQLFSVGMKYVIVNGKVAVENGVYNGALAGRALRKTIPSSVDANSPVAITNEPHHRLKFENEYLRVWDTLIPAGDATLWHRHDHDNVVINLSDAAIRVENAGAGPSENQVKFGEVGFRKSSYIHRVMTIGATPFHNMAIEILRSPPTPNISGTVAPMGRVPIIDNDRVRVYRLSLHPGEATGMHTHLLSGLGVFMTAAEVIVETPGGEKPQRSKPQAGDVLWRAGAVTHSIRNVGKTRLEAVDIELK